MDESQITQRILIGMTQQEVIAALGEPDDKGGTSRKYPAPSIFKYGTIELFFAKGTEGQLEMIYSAPDDRVIGRLQ